MSGKTKFPAEKARLVALQLSALLQPVSQRVVIAGSLRRQRAEVGDIEIVFQPFRGDPVCDIFGELLGWDRSPAEKLIDGLLFDGTLKPRPNVNGSTIVGEKNKLLVHVPSGIPVDLFAEVTGEETAWWSLLTCRTGGAQTNIRLASGAKTHLRKWESYTGVYDFRKRQTLPATCEADIFAACGVPYAEPEFRD